MPNTTASEMARALVTQASDTDTVIPEDVSKPVSEPEPEPEPVKKAKAKAKKAIVIDHVIAPVG